VPLPLSLRFNGHFPGGPGLASTRIVSILDFIAAKDDRGGANNWSTRRAKFQSKCHRQQTNTQFFTGWMPFLPPNRVNALKG